MGSEPHRIPTVQDHLGDEERKRSRGSEECRSGLRGDSPGKGNGDGLRGWFGIKGSREKSCCGDVPIQVCNLRVGKSRFDSTVSQLVFPDSGVSWNMSQRDRTNLDSPTVGLT